jgi:hypothetical protein
MAVDFSNGNVCKGARMTEQIVAEFNAIIWLWGAIALAVVVVLNRRRNGPRNP